MKKFYLLLTTLFAVNISFAQISTVPFSSGYNLPVDIKNCGDDRLFVVEQRGWISICDTDGVRRPDLFLDIRGRVVYSSEQGLLGLAFPPDFATSRCFYVDYTRLDGATRISRFHLMNGSNDMADSTSEEILLTIYQPYSNHNGGHVFFGPDGYLYIGMGDGGSGGDPGNRAQNPDSLLGKMLRLEVDPSYPGYHIPPTNVFAQDTTLGRPEIWALGVRNPWRWSFDRLTGDLWIADVGQNMVEEIDFQPANAPSGLNYGWRCWEGTSQYSTATSCLPLNSYVVPVHTYTHTGGNCSITGGYIYRGTKFQELYGKYFYADYCNSQIQYLSDSTGPYTNTNLGSLGATSVTTFGLDRHGEMYLTSGGSSIRKIVSADCSPVSTINAGVDTVSDCGNGFAVLTSPYDSLHSYLWTDGVNVIDSTNSITVSQPGVYFVTVDNNGCSSTDSVIVAFRSGVTFTGLDSMVCIYHSGMSLVPSIIGGSFSGPGLLGATFFPGAAGVGTHQIVYAIHTDGCLLSDTQTVVVDQCAGIPELWTSNMKIIPNPSDGAFNISVFSYSERQIDINVSDIAGRWIQKRSVSLSQGENLLQFDLQLNSGVYLMKISEGSQEKILKLVIQ